ncbi:MAG: hormogonium polysaccharide secretion pseudopilin HpsC [Limnoraphis sp.]
MNNPLRLLLQSRIRQKKSSSITSEQGFTMVELLVGAIVAFLIMGPLLGFVVNILNDDKREGVKAATEQELQTALDYIKSDLNQAVYIYDSKGIETLAKNANPVFPTAQGNPVLVFFKRKFIEDGIDVSGCTPAGEKVCQDDTHVLSLVAYYLEQRTTNAWCPSRSNCPAQITRFEVQDGVRDPTSGDYVCGALTGIDGCDEEASRKRSEGFPTTIDTANLTNLVKPEDFENTPEVLVNYIDATTANVPELVECVTPGIKKDNGIEKRGFTNEAEAKAAMTSNPGKINGNNPNSFYACIDTFTNTAQVYVRANALRRIQEDADYDADKSTFFPISSIQVKGISGFGD